MAQEPGLPAGCVGSYPDPLYCSDNGGWYNPNPDKCYPLDGNPRPSQQVYIQDEFAQPQPLNQNFCLNLPNRNSVFLNQAYYSQGNRPTIVDAEGYVQSYCFGDVAGGALPLPSGAIQAAHVIKDFRVPGRRFMQLWGYLNCDPLNIECAGTAADPFYGAGQYDSGAFEHCGKEPYSGVNQDKNPGFSVYYMKAGSVGGRAGFCMRVCEGDHSVGMPCDISSPQQDIKGCEVVMPGLVFTEGWTYMDAADGIITTGTFGVAQPTKAAVATTTTAIGPAATTTTTSASVDTATTTTTSLDSTTTSSVTSEVTSAVSSFSVLSSATSGVTSTVSATVSASASNSASSSNKASDAVHTQASSLVLTLSISMAYLLF
ncbi:hypothetical protein BCR33DRAFT_738472 [Rhizoclosmatium globosum]|uniref:Uncharacterized protein n=1 Tax=Rhizoclosmatium globosum TaxID=329046 RepID=A0A1Y2C9X0_9FUNG|nr:hypothetical protein BCR33DRAFT_738472 [Rhizoclosmatium globosum]|eukprot:ORY43736.1 hypothetical protein BCR33DRAFT_738472 [Rhizoclosmatium globosum]